LETLEWEDDNEEQVADKQAAMRCMNNLNYTQKTVITATNKTQQQKQYRFKAKEYIYLTQNCGYMKRCLPIGILCIDFSAI